ncbi:hypothetical protein TNCV_2762411 [Trichonephila clavipes]|nr:hypothetical protein TNCV_2762411 [Trichonephila clavipes]
MLDHLKDNIRRVIADIPPQMLEKVIENWTSRLDYIRGSRGSPIPEIYTCSDPFGAGKPTPSPFDLSTLQCHAPGLDLQTTVSGKCPSSPKDEQEKQGESRDSKERLYPLQNTTQVTASKARYCHSMSPGTLAL